MKRMVALLLLPLLVLLLARETGSCKSDHPTEKPQPTGPPEIPLQTSASLPQHPHPGFQNPGLAPGFKSTVGHPIATFNPTPPPGGHQVATFNPTPPRPFSCEDQYGRTRRVGIRKC